MFCFCANNCFFLNGVYDGDGRYALDGDGEGWPDAEGERPRRTERVEAEEAGELRRYGAWSAEFGALNLPPYRTLYLLLGRVPVDVIREALRVRLDQKPREPSALSIRQLIHEFKEGLRAGVACLFRYRRDVRSVLLTPSRDHSQQVRSLFFSLQPTLRAPLPKFNRGEHEKRTYSDRIQRRLKRNQG